MDFLQSIPTWFNDQISYLIQSILTPAVKFLTITDGWALAVLILVAMVIKSLPFRYKALSHDGIYRFFTYVGRVMTFIFGFNIGMYGVNNNWFTMPHTIDAYVTSSTIPSLDQYIIQNGWALAVLVLAAIVIKGLPFRYETLRKDGAYRFLTYVGRVGTFIFAVNFGIFVITNGWFTAVPIP